MGIAKFISEFKEFTSRRKRDGRDGGHHRRQHLRLSSRRSSVTLSSPSSCSLRVAVRRIWLVIPVAGTPNGIDFGAFISAIINFLIIALVVFLLSSKASTSYILQAAP